MKENRVELAYMEGKTVHCKGIFADTRVLKGNFISLLFKDICIDGSIYYDHIWVVYTKAFQGKDLKSGCTVEFDGDVEQYRHEKNRYGISFCRNVRIVSYDREEEAKRFCDIRVALKNINYNGNKYVSSSEKKAFQEFEDSYHLDKRERIRLVYSPAMTFANQEGEIEFDAYDSNGETIEFSKVSFNPLTDDHKLSIDDKYYVKITETAYRQLSLIYFMVMKNPTGCMSYVPDEVSGDYFEVVNEESSSYYHDGRFMYTIPKKRDYNLKEVMC